MNSNENIKRYNSPEEDKQELIRYRDEFINDMLPEELKTSDPDYDKYKFRGNFFQGIVATLHNMISAGTISEPRLLSRVNEFIKHVTEEIDFSKFVPKEDVDKANTMLDEVINSIP